MNLAFEFLEWYNENYTAEHLIFAVLGVFAIIGAITYFLVDTQMLYFSLFVGGALAVNFYIVTLIQRKYISSTKSKLEDIDYLPEDEEEADAN